MMENISVQFKSRKQTDMFNEFFHLSGEFRQSPWHKMPRQKMVCLDK